MAWFKSKSRQVYEFRKDRTRQSDSDFLLALGLPETDAGSRVGLAVRRAVAAVGLVDPMFIYADDGIRQLEVLPTWDSMDWVELVLELEDELGVEISDRVAEKLSPRWESEFTIRAFAKQVWETVPRLRE